MPCDARLRGLRGPNLKDIKRASISKTADLSYVNCHLTPLPTTSNSTSSSVPPGSSSRSGVERELNQGFSSYKSPSTPAGELQQADRNKKGHKMGLALCSQETWSPTAAPPQTVREENRTMDGEVRSKHKAAPLIGNFRLLINNHRFPGHRGIFNY